MSNKDALTNLIKNNKSEVAPPSNEVWSKISDHINKRSQKTPLILSFASLFIVALGITIYTSQQPKINSTEAATILLEAQEDYLNETYEDEEYLASY